jgi:hypothetical protein
MDQNNTNKENDFSLHNLDNYYKKFNYNVSEILDKYIYLTNEFLKFILEKIKSKNNRYVKFIIIRGYETLTNVFNIILYYTKNVELTFYHCQKSYYYYIEFIEQISYEQHVFLDLNSRDASTYVYKKILFDLNHDFKKNMVSCDNETKIIIEKLDYEIKLIKLIFDFVIENLNLDNKSFNINIKMLAKYEKMCRKIIISKLKIENINSFYKIIENINNNFIIYHESKQDNLIENEYPILEKYFELISNIMKKCSRKGYNIDFLEIIKSNTLNQ